MSVTELLKKKLEKAVTREQAEEAIKVYLLGQVIIQKEKVCLILQNEWLKLLKNIFQAI